MENINPKSDKIELDELASVLTDLNSKQNEGRGVSCVRAIILSLERGDVEGAKAILSNEGDKIRNYPEIESILKEYFGN